MFWLGVCREERVRIGSRELERSVVARVENVM